MVGEIGFPIGEKIVKSLFHKKIIVVFCFSYPSKLYLCGLRKELEKCKKKCKQRMTASITKRKIITFKG